MASISDLARQMVKNQFATPRPQLSPPVHDRDEHSSRIQPAGPMTPERANKVIESYYKGLTTKSLQDPENEHIKKAMFNQAKIMALVGLKKQVKVVEFFMKHNLLVSNQDGKRLIESFTETMDYLQSYEYEQDKEL